MKECHRLKDIKEKKDDDQYHKDLLEENKRLKEASKTDKKYNDLMEENKKLKESKWL